MRRIKEGKLCEKIARKKGYTNLDWLCPEFGMKKNKKGGYENANIRYVLYGRPKNYKGSYGDYIEPIIAEVENKNYTKKLGYREVLEEDMFGIIVGKFLMN